MSSASNTRTTIANGLDPRVLLRVLEEGYGPGAWHGADLKAAVADVSAELAFWRPADGRHNIAEITLHHAYYVHSVRGRLSSAPLEPFALAGDDWFPLAGNSTMSWSDVRSALENEQRKLAGTLIEIIAGRIEPSLSDAERLDNVLGITCHAVYHAGQIQLIKRLRAE